LDVDAIDGVRAIEDDHRDASITGCFYQIGHGGGIGVEAGADVGKVDDELVDAGEHHWGGAPCRVGRAVEVVDGNLRRYVLHFEDIGGIELSRESVLGRKDSDQLAPLAGG